MDTLDSIQFHNRGVVVFVFIIHQYSHVPRIYEKQVYSKELMLVNLYQKLPLRED